MRLIVCGSGRVVSLREESRIDEIEYVSGLICESDVFLGVLGWYGLWIVGGGLTFFYAGSKKWLEGIQKRRVRRLGEVSAEKASRPAMNGNGKTSDTGISDQSMKGGWRLGLIK